MDETADVFSQAATQGGVLVWASARRGRVRRRGMEDFIFGPRGKWAVGWLALWGFMRFVRGRSARKWKEIDKPFMGSYVRG
jgi:hypothetical protein